MTIFATKYGGGLLDGVPLLCTLYALSIFFEIFYLFIYFIFFVVSAKTLDIWSTRTDLVSDQQFSLAWWYLMLLCLRVFLRNLFFSFPTSLSNWHIVSNCLLVLSFWSFILNFKLYTLSLLLLALALVSSPFFSVSSILIYIYLSVASNVSSILLKSSIFSLISALVSSKLLLVLLLELLSFSFPGIIDLI